MKVLKIMCSMAALTLSHSRRLSVIRPLTITAVSWRQKYQDIENACFIPTSSQPSTQQKNNGLHTFKSGHQHYRNSRSISRFLSSVFSHHGHQTTNRYARFRTSLLDHKRNQEINSINTSLEISQQAISLLANKQKHTWNRLRPIIELAESSKDDGHVSNPRSSDDGRLKTIADIGCDHGLLAIALALSGHYQKVIGVDASHRALSNGAFQFHEKLKSILQHEGEGEVISPSDLPLEFRFGNGLEPLQPGESDGICIAGMGVETMLSILTKEGTKTDDDSLDATKSLYLNDIGCTRLFLQSAKSRPRHLMQLYQTLHENGWDLVDERISFLRRRWYITSSFGRHYDHNDKNEQITERNMSLPGSILKVSPMSSSKEEYGRYVEHHTQWLEKDLKRKGTLHPSDMIWLHHNK